MLSITFFLNNKLRVRGHLYDNFHFLGMTFNSLGMLICELELLITRCWTLLSCFYLQSASFLKYYILPKTRFLESFDDLESVSTLAGSKHRLQFIVRDNKVSDILFYVIMFFCDRRWRNIIIL